MTELRYPDPVLTDGTVTLRPWNDGDIECVRQAATDKAIPQGTTVPANYTPAGGLAFVGRQQGRLTSGHGISMAICSPTIGTAVGLVILSVRPQPGVAGIGYWIVPAARRRSLATRAIGLITAWGLGNLGLARIEAWVEPGNTASRRALLANGYEDEGRLRNFLGVDHDRTDALVLSRIATDNADSARP